MVNPHNAYARQCVQTGAIIFGIGFGIIGFAIGFMLVVAYHWPMPPMLLVEGSVIVGATLGALLGWAWSTHIGRYSLCGFVAAGLIGALLNWLVAGEAITLMALQQDCMLGAIGGLVAVMRGR
jgi:hypothetical protein